MSGSKTWTVQVHIDEHSDERQTIANARLAEEHGDLIGQGYARRNPVDREIPSIGDELAVARALSDLAHQLLETAASDIESVTHRPAHLSV